MLKIFFFASVREQLNCAALDLELLDHELDLAGLQERLCREQGKHWRAVLEQDNMIRAVNQVVVPDNCPLRDGDEVAFYPPVTGG